MCFVIKSYLNTGNKFGYTQIVRYFKFTETSESWGQNLGRDKIPKKKKIINSKVYICQ